MKIIKKQGFTLAEVLVTLGIIGVVAAMTLPSVIKKQEELSTISELKKTFSILTQAHARVVEKNSTPDAWGLTEGQAGAQSMLNLYKPYLKVAKDCGTGTGCMASGYLRYSGNVDIDGATTVSKVILADGMSLMFSTYTGCIDNSVPLGAGNNTCGFIYVDVNGAKKPNVYGKDFFDFWITKKNGIVPGGVPSDNQFTNACKVYSGKSWGCAAWVIYNENRDYLKCASQLSWTGNRRCP